jgi:cytochrome bd-type quinol oxidase subunit 2
MKKIQLIITSLALVLGVASTAFVPAGVASAADSSQKSVCEGSGGSWNGNKCTRSGEASLQDQIEQVVNVLLFVLGAISVIMIIIGGIRYATSNGDSSQITSARNTILYAVIGLIVAILAFAIVNFVINQFS